MARILLQLPPPVHQALWAHLVPPNTRNEEVAFVYVNQENSDGTQIFEYVEWFPVPMSGFQSRSSFHLELGDETRALVIKRAHDLGTCLVEFHSHLGPWPARFSPSDFLGFREFVPHVWWRLKGRPYLAVVVTKSDFDGLAWITTPQITQRLDGIVVDKHLLTPTGLSPLDGELYE